MKPLVSIQNLGPKQFQEGVRRELKMFNGLNKTIHGGEMVWKKTEFKNSWTISPHVLDSVFFKATKLASALDYLSATFQHQGFGYSFWGAKGSLYWFYPVLRQLMESFS